MKRKTTPPNVTIFRSLATSRPYSTLSRLRQRRHEEREQPTAQGDQAREQRCGSSPLSSGRIGLACALVEAGYSVAAVQLAGGWKSTSMIARYSAPLEAERGAVAQCFAGVDPAGAAGRPAAQIVQFEARTDTGGHGETDGEVTE